MVIGFCLSTRYLKIFNTFKLNIKNNDCDKLGLLAAISQNYARKNQVSIDSLQFKYEVINNLYEESEVDVISLFENESKFESNKPTKESVLLCGFYFDGGRWDREKNVVFDSPQRFTSVPHFSCQLIQV